MFLNSSTSLIIFSILFVKLLLIFGNKTTDVHNNRRGVGLKNISTTTLRPTITHILKAAKARSVKHSRINQTGRLIGFNLHNKTQTKHPQLPMSSSHPVNEKTPKHATTPKPVPIHTPKSISMPVHRPTTSKPSHNPTTSKPSHNPTTSKPSHNPTTSKPSHNPIHKPMSMPRSMTFDDTPGQVDPYDKINRLHKKIQKAVHVLTSASNEDSISWNKTATSPDEGESGDPGPPGHGPSGIEPIEPPEAPEPPEPISSSVEEPDPINSESTEVGLNVTKLDPASGPPPEEGGDPLEVTDGENNDESFYDKEVEKTLGPDCLQAKKYLDAIEPVYSAQCHKQELATWLAETHVTDENEEKSAEAETELNNYQQKIQSEILKKFPNWRSLTGCDDLRRQLKLLSREGPGTMDPLRNDKLNKLKNDMLSAYADASMCPYNKTPKEQCTLKIDPDITSLMKEAKDYDELHYYWEGWHDTMSKVVSAKTYSEWAALRNERSKANGFKETTDEWADEYDDGSANWSGKLFQKEVMNIWTTIKPYYLKLHAFVRMKLKQVYGDRMNSSLGYIPAHILGNMWAEEWDSVEEAARPYPNAVSFDVTKALKQHKYTVKRLYKEADRFYRDLGLLPMNKIFWTKSMLVQPKGREVLCDPTAFDMCLRSHDMGASGDYRIKMCTEVNQLFLESVQHEMGHVQYYMQYSHLPYPFRNGANPAFHEAIGDALSLAVTTPKHLHCVLGFDIRVPIDCDSFESTAITEADINNLFRRSLNTIAFLPSALSMEEWRWEIFAGKLKKADYNNRWWELRRKNQGIIPDKPRPPDAFDAAGKFHVLDGNGFIRYFISVLLQFQFFQGMCVAAREYQPKSKRPDSKPLYQCDFSGSRDAGWALKKMMEIGSSKPWPEALKLITGSSKLSVDPLVNYFQPLFDKIEKDLLHAKEKPCFAEHCKKQG